MTGKNGDLFSAGLQVLSLLAGVSWIRSRLLTIGTVIGVILGLIAIPTPTLGSELCIDGGDYAIGNWQVEQGLPHISVTSIAQTPDGYLWVGTFSGLARFDGVRFKVFTEGNTPMLGHNAITSLQVDEQGALWIVTMAGGLVRMAGGNFTTIQKEETQLLLGGSVSNRSGDRLVLLDRQTRWRQIRTDQLLPLDCLDAPKDAAPSFLFKNACSSWIRQRGEIIQSYRSTFPVLTDDGINRLPSNVLIHSAAASMSGGYWVATSNGIYRLLQGRISARLAPLPVDVHQQFLMQEDGQGHLWVGKWGDGIFHLDPKGEWQHFNIGRGLADNYVNCLLRDREGNLWVGTGQGGLHRIRPRAFQMYHTTSGPNVVMSVTQDRKGRMWFGINGGGLHTWANGSLKRVTDPPALMRHALAYSVLADREDALWIGLYGLKALRWESGTVSLHDLDDGSSRVMTPNALFEDRSGTVWLGCVNGLLRHETGRLIRYTTRDGLSSDSVVALAEDRAGSLYIGTDGGGLNCLRQNRFTSWTQRDGVADNHIASLYMDDEDTLWVGTVNGGLSRLKHGRFRSVGLSDGLPTETVGRMIEDGLGNLWFGSNRGIIRVNRHALNQYLDGKGGPVVWRTFGLSEGLSTISCVGASQPACWKAQDGKLWFSSIKGVAVVDPNHIPFNPLPPPVVIEEVVLDDQPQKGFASSLKVLPRTHRIEFHFTGLSLMASEKVRFRYRLEHFDGNWIDAGTRRVAYYSGIRPGHYRFQVSACNNDGVWNEKGATLGLVVLPPWWMTWWSRCFMGLGLAGVVFVWYEGRLHRLRRQRLVQESFARRLIDSQEKERQRIAGALHDGLGQDLLVIASQAQLSLRQQENPPDTTVHLEEIAKTAKQALHHARCVVRDLRPGLLEELGLTKAVQAIVTKAAQASGISMKVNLTDADDLLPPEFEVNLFRIIQEMLNNVLKHARASEVQVTVTIHSGSLRLIVEDNGCGFELSLVESGPPDLAGFGLRQISERAKLMGGRVNVQARPGQGTRLTVDVPLKTLDPTPACARHVP